RIDSKGGIPMGQERSQTQAVAFGGPLPNGSASIDFSLILPSYYFYRSNLSPSDPLESKVNSSPCPNLWRERRSLGHTIPAGGGSCNACLNRIPKAAHQSARIGIH